MRLEVDAVTFDDFGTLRYSASKQEDIIYPIFRALSKRGISLTEETFLNQYFDIDALYRRKLKKTSRESLLDNLIADVLRSLGFKPEAYMNIIKESVDYGLSTRSTKWYLDALFVLSTLRKRGYKLGLISNTHWRLLENARTEMAKSFGVITLSYEHGYAKPHPSIFLATLKKLEVKANCCLHVGDDPITDVQGAKNVGMKTAFIKRRNLEANADIIIDRLNQLLELLDKNSNRSDKDLNVAR